MSTRTKLLFLAGIMGIAVVTGTLQALTSPRKVGKKEGDQKDARQGGKVLSELAGDLE
jgi:hypothetical protein